MFLFLCLSKGRGKPGKTRTEKRLKKKKKKLTEEEVVIRLSGGRFGYCELSVILIRVWEKEEQKVSAYSLYIVEIERSVVLFLFLGTIGRRT
jgi:hypothetical protein